MLIILFLIRLVMTNLDSTKSTINTAQPATLAAVPTTIRRLYRGQATQDGAGVSLTRIIGQGSLPRLDPFLMLDEFGSDKPQDYLAGFPPHPHRGFQTVTYMLQGKMGHKDSVGNTGLIEDGGLQWMNAGKGIIHEEMPQQTHGVLRGFQLWVNLPATDKLSAPAYHDIPSENVPEVDFSGGLVRVLAGEYAGVTGAVEAQAVKPQFYDIHFTATTTLSVDTIAKHNGFIFVYEGEVTVQGQTVSKGHLAQLDIESLLTIEAVNDTRLIFVSGEPLNEPIYQYGPFVMNTQAEIDQAMRDYRDGTLTD